MMILVVNLFVLKVIVTKGDTLMSLKFVGLEVGRLKQIYERINLNDYRSCEFSL